MIELKSFDLRTKTFSNLLWRMAERFFAQIISFLLSIVLARILGPEVYGTIALVLVFINILQVFVDSGLANALIQKKDADELDFSTVFYFNIIWCISLYVLLFLCAPLIASFYQDESLINIIRVLGLTVVIAGLKNVQQAYVSRNLQFRKFFWSSFGGTLASAVIGVVMAVKGYGIWALVAQYLINLLLGTIILWIIVKWRPAGGFSWERLTTLYSYGWKLLASGLIDAFYENLCQLIIGKKYSVKDLAYYNRGEKFPNVIVSNINRSIDSVLFPVLSGEQEDKARVKTIVRRAIKTSTYIMAPLMIGLCVTADTIVSIILTEKWILCVPYLRIFCISYMFMPIHTANLNAIKALGRSDLFLKLEVIKKIVGMSILIVSAHISVMAMAYSMLIINVLCQFINSWPNRRLLNYSYYNQMVDIIPGILLSCVMGGAVYAMSFSSFDIYVRLLLQVALGGVIYILGSIIFGLEEYVYMKETVTRVIKTD